MAENPNPLNLLWLLISLFFCGLLAVIPVGIESQEIFESFSMEPDVMVASGANANVIYVNARQTAPEKWQFSVTVEHPDTGWEDYADGWDVVLPDGSVVKASPDDRFTRLLLHPHENEQPFTRSQSGLYIPADVAEVRVRAHDLVDGWGGREIVVNLTVAAGEGFEVQR